MALEDTTINYFYNLYILKYAYVENKIMSFFPYLASSSKNTHIHAVPKML